MANALFDPGREGFLFAEIAWGTGTIKCSAVRSYTFVASHKFLTDATGAGAVLVSTVTLGTKTGPAGVANAANPTFPSVAAGAAITSLLLYQSSAPAGGADLATSAQRLIGYIDNALNLPVTPNGGNIDVGWDLTATTKIFKL